MSEETTEEEVEDRTYDEKVEKLRNLVPIKKALEKARKPKYTIDPSLKQEIRLYFGAAVYRNGEKDSYMPSEMRSKKDVNDFIGVLERVQADKDRVGGIKMGLEDVQSELQDLWDLGYNYIIQKDPVIGKLRSIEMRDRAVKHVMLDLWVRLNNVNKLIKNCDDVMSNLQSTYFTCSTMLKAAEFSIQEIKTDY